MEQKKEIIFKTNKILKKLKAFPPINQKESFAAMETISKFLFDWLVYI